MKMNYKHNSSLFVWIFVVALVITSGNSYALSSQAGIQARKANGLGDGEIVARNIKNSSPKISNIVTWSVSSILTDGNCANIYSSDNFTGWVSRLQAPNKIYSSFPTETFQLFENYFTKPSVRIQPIRPCFKKCDERN